MVLISTSINANAFETAMVIRELYSKIMYAIIEGEEELGLTQQQIIVVKLIAHNKEMTISELCKEMSLSKGTVSGIVQRLEKVGYIQKLKKHNDLRNTYIAFSEEGVEFAKVFKEKINYRFSKIFKNISDNELKNINKSLMDILSKIEER